ncbi:hypothetical protein CKAH01_03794 [Colletotrichum kahawae]|uniref:NAD-dependent epimerase/dehydratase domain-containing protein n=1 Tax=Colletotrichum kahawae TaxID=34407 RepID=A0AAD9YNY6_COLKA|nr:hypothetical protein CKAH01_03794 [Colletotrichum kahawae]
MLILIAGITGLTGEPCARSALARGHKVRGLARDPSKIPSDIREKLEGVEILHDIRDQQAIERAGSPAWTPLFFMPALGSYDWRLGPGTHELYDELQAFAHHVALSSQIKPIYMFTGAIAEYVFRRSLRDWDPATKTLQYHGHSTFPIRYTTAADLGNYVIEAISAPDAADGGYLRVQSFEASPEDVVGAYNRARDGSVRASHKCVGTVEDAKAKLDEGRAKFSKRDCWNYMWYVYQYHIPMRTWDYGPVDVARFPDVKQTSLEDFFRGNPDV